MVCYIGAFFELCLTPTNIIFLCWKRNLNPKLLERQMFGGGEESTDFANRSKLCVFPFLNASWLVSTPLNKALADLHLHRVLCRKGLGLDVHEG